MSQDDAESLTDEAESLAQAVDDFRERLIAADVDDDIIALWLDVATHAWDAANALTSDGES